MLLIIAILQDTFEEIYYKFVNLVYKIVREMLDDEDDIQTAVQDTFLRVYLYYDKLRDKSKLKSWIAQIARNQAYTVRRKKPFHYEALDDTVSDPVHNPETTFLEQNAVELILSELSGMKKSYRDVLLLKYHYGFKRKEIASMLGVTPQDVSYKLNAAERKLKQILGEKEAAEHENGSGV